MEEEDEEKKEEIKQETEPEVDIEVANVDMMIPSPPQTEIIVKEQIEEAKEEDAEPEP